ncbi:MAG: hypothetical protein LBH25_05925 [Fibromonadaceae bacterium]|nr:hypothetical protein [Fibromonadaceae bacterium]
MPNGKNILKAMAAATIVAASMSAVGCEDANGDSFKDSRDGKTYKTVKIGERTWMAENLNHQTGNSWCYDENADNCKKYGRLYDWHTAMKACPSDWRLPNGDDWNDLCNATGCDNKLKSKSGWDNNGSGTDDFGFSALPGGRGGRGKLDDSFSGIGEHGSWWGWNSYNDPEEGISEAYCERMVSGQDNLYSNDFDDKDGGCSVRCVRD